MTRVLIVAAHPDDELLGVAGTIARHTADGDQVTCVVCSEGATARYEAGAIGTLQDSGQRAARLLGVRELRFLGMRDQHLDAQPVLTVIQAIEAVVREVAPEVVYTHHWGDVNRDHKVVNEAVMVACRPVGDDYPRAVYLFETPSSTEWSWPDPASAFVPNHFVDVTATIERKLEAMACYATELRPPPHPRSLEALRSRAAYWGQLVGRAYAEPFVVARQVR
ncbi:MAG TPA: PIG-L deacetylase family protein [Kofleriaceae bacterium]|nr:PIG-L deacetylase family protein [Kofleriaceae bacterium]